MIGQFNVGLGRALIRLLDAHIRLQFGVARGMLRPGLTSASEI
jgi:hypothetical protein